MHLTFFDLDQTLLTSDSDYEWNRFLIDENLVDATDYAEANDRFAAEYAAGTLDIHAYQRFALGPLITHGHDRLAALRARFLEERVMPCVAPHAFHVLDFHRQRGDLIAIITATNAFVTEPIAAYLQVDHLIATNPEIVDGRYTGAIAGTPSFREGKIERAQVFQAEQAPEAESVTFYSDSRNDLPLLEWADHPVAVDPDDTLREAAHQRGWSIVSLRGAQPPELA